MARADDPVFTYADGGTADRTVVNSPAGGIGINSDGDVFVSTLGIQDMWRFPAPIPPISGTAYPADKRIFLPLQFDLANHVGPTAFNTARGLAVAGSQLILTDYGRLMFWNNTSTLTNGQPADGCLGELDTPRCLFEGIGRISRVSADKASHLWVLVNPDNQLDATNRRLPAPLEREFDTIRHADFPSARFRRWKHLLGLFLSG